MTWEGILYLENTCTTKSLAMVGVLIVWCVGMKIACFVRQSTITKISVKLSEVGSHLIKSMEIDSQGHSGIGSCLRKP